MASKTLIKYAGWLRKDMFKLIKSLVRFENSLFREFPSTSQQQIRNLKQLRSALYDMDESLAPFQGEPEDAPAPPQPKPKTVKQKPALRLPPPEPVSSEPSAHLENIAEVDENDEDLRQSAENISPLQAPVQIANIANPVENLAYSPETLQHSAKNQLNVATSIHQPTVLVEATATTIGEETSSNETVPFGKGVMFVENSQSVVYKPKPLQQSVQNPVNVAPSLHQPTVLVEATATIIAEETYSNETVPFGKGVMFVPGSPTFNSFFNGLPGYNPTGLQNINLTKQSTFIKPKYRNSTTDTDCPVCKHKFFDRKNLRRHIHENKICSQQVSWDDVKKNSWKRRESQSGQQIKEGPGTPKTAFTSSHVIPRNVRGRENLAKYPPLDSGLKSMLDALPQETNNGSGSESSSPDILDRTPN